MSCEERCEPSEHAFRRPALHLFGGAVYAYQMPSDAMPGPSRRQRYTMEDPTKESRHLRPNSVALFQDFSLKWALSAHRWGRSNAAKQCKNGCGMTKRAQPSGTTHLRRVTHIP